MNETNQNNRSQSPIDDGDTVTFFPTCGYRNPANNGWKVEIHGWIYRVELDSLRRAAALDLLRRTLRMSRETIESDLMKKRLRAFLVDNQPDKRVSVRIGSATYVLPESTPNGHFRTTLDLPDDTLTEVDGRDTYNIQRLTFSAMNCDGRKFTSELRLIPQRGVSVISDIDDTIKISNVRDRRELMANTFLREFRAAPAMADTYRRWEDSGVCFHYVSAGPWQLFQPLDSLLKTERFAGGTLHLRNFRVKDRSLKDFLADTHQAKRKVIELIMANFPHRKFVLVGDSGESDPEMYAALARELSQQVKHIYIRNVTGESIDSERFRQAFTGIAAHRWTLFDESTGIATNDDVISDASRRKS